MLVAWVALISIPLGLGQIGLSWDALNHHIYLGWVGNRPRFDRDFLAASYQSYQFPYLYWPVYKLSQSGLSGAWAGTVLASLQWLAVPALWVVARACIPGSTVFDAAMRVMAVALALMSTLFLSLFDSTSNDLLASVPLVWAVAFAMVALDTVHRKQPASRAVMWSGLFAGVAIACKLSNGPLAVLMPLLWLHSASALKSKLLNTLLGVAAILVGFFLSYGYWGWELWSHFGNPVYPFYDGMFVGPRAWLGWHP